MNVAAERSSSRIPVTDVEVPFLEALGARVRFRRELLGLSRRELAILAEVSAAQLGKIEWGVRRTRRSTLERMAPFLVGYPDPPDSAVQEVVDELVALAGPALAAESDYADRVARRRARRVRKGEKVDDQVFKQALPMARNLAAQAVADYRATGKWPEWMRS